MAYQFMGRLRELCPNTPLIYDTVDISYLRARREHELRRILEDDTSPNIDEVRRKRSENIKKLEKIDMFVMSKSSLIFVVSTFEFNLMKKKLKNRKNITLLSNIYPAGQLKDISLSEFESRKSILFVGNMCHPPNVDAVEFILSEILPKINEDDRLNFTMNIVMSNLKTCPRNNTLALATKFQNVVIHRDVSNFELNRLYQLATVFLCPLRVGAGVKGKINQALYNGVPVIGGDVAVEGMRLVSDESVLMAETADEYCKGVYRLMTNFTLWNVIRRAGILANNKYFSREIALQTLNSSLIHLNVIPKHRHMVSDPSKLMSCRIFDKLAPGSSSNESSSLMIGKCLKKTHPFFIMSDILFNEKYLKADNENIMFPRVVSGS